MRVRTSAAVAAGGVLGAGLAVTAASRFAARAALRPAGRSGRLPAGFEGAPLTVHRVTGPERPPSPDGGATVPPGTSGATVYGTGGPRGGTASGTEGGTASGTGAAPGAGPEPGGVRRIALTRSLTALLPGTYGLSGRGCHAVLGPVVEGADGEAEGGADTVVRELRKVTHGSFAPGTRARLTPALYTGDPESALGLSCTHTTLPGESGLLPAWFVPGDRDTWVIAVHGLGTSREHPMNLLPFLHRRRVPVLIPGYRGDPAAPAVRDGLSRLGAQEWRDLDAAIRHALRHGAERVVLLGWSTGATMALHAAVASALRRRITGLVLDSPVLSPQATVRALAAARRTPRALLPLTVRAADGLAGLDTERVTVLADAERLDVPTLVFHGPGDLIAPWETSQALAERHPALAGLHPVEKAPHAAMWNADPQAYERALGNFLTPLL